MMRWIFSLSCFICLVASSQDIDVLHYQFSIELNDKNDTILGVAAIRFVQHSNTKTATFDLTALNKEGKGMKVLSVSGGLEGSTVHYFTHVGDRLTVELPKPKKDDTVGLSIAYKGVPDDGLIIARNKYGDRTFLQTTGRIARITGFRVMTN